MHYNDLYFTTKETEGHITLTNFYLNPNLSVPSLDLFILYSTTIKGDNF